MKTKKEIIKIMEELHPGACGHLGLGALNMVEEVVSLTNPKSILEIGFNAGHSASMWLGFSNAKLTSLDVARPPWLTWEGGMKDSVSVIKKHFGDRFEFYIADSQNLETRKQPYMIGHDLFFIDGAHEEAPCAHDIETAILFGAKYIFLDDYVDSSPTVIYAANQFKDSLKLIRRFKLDNYDVGEYTGHGDINNAALFEVIR